MHKNPALKRGDTTPVTGGVDLPSHLISSFPEDADVPTDDLGRQAYWLLKINASKISLRFRQPDLAGMNDDAKRRLIADIQAALGVVPFNKATL